MTDSSSPVSATGPSAPAPVDAEALGRALAGNPLVRSVSVVESTGSTNADLLSAAATGAVAGSVRIAEFQSSGRGRHERSWGAPPRTQLAMSVAVAVGADVPPQAWGWLPLLAGLAVTDAVAGLGVQAGLKWPNDVLIDGHKAVGILVELTSGRDGMVAVIGMGVNTGLEPEDLPVPTATSLHRHTDEPVDRTVLAAAILDALAARLGHWPDDLDTLAADYRARSVTIDRRVRVELPGEREIVGTVTDIDPSGRVVVTDDEGADHQVTAGDVTHLRPVD